ncbi:MAG: ParB/RepB/Spo0J family partition protein [Clostridia bacterium]|nr:ParB/RepB/Spo0J family partition protein [Clostridia bacterium]
MAKQRGLGRGLDALFTESDIAREPSSEASTLRLTQIEPNKEQPRKTFDQKALQELAKSIEANGVLQPMLVRPMEDGSYQLVAGERRWRASRMAGLTEVPVIIREMSDEQAMQISLIENLQREDLNPIEEAEGLQLLISRYSLTQEEAASRVGRSRPAIANSIRLLGLPEEVRELTRNGDISAGHARALLALGNADEMVSAAAQIKKEELSVRDVERLVKDKQDAKKGKSRAKKAKARDSYYDEVELAMTEAIGRKVTVKLRPNAKGKGTLEFDFFSKEDLGKLANALDRALKE